MPQNEILDIKRWNNVHALTILLSGILAFALSSTWPVVVVAGVSFLYYTLTFLTKTDKGFLGGIANQVTLFRLVLLLFLALVYSRFSDQTIAMLLGAIIVLDILDGYLARKYGLSSNYGLYLDMESDALFVCLAALMIYLNDYAGAWIIFIGFLRYINVSFYVLFRLPAKKEPKRVWASYIAGYLFFALVTPFFIPAPWYLPVLVSASVLVVFSFAVSFVYYIRN